MVSVLAAKDKTESLALPADDRGLAYGDGLFETIRVRRGHPDLWHAHCQRMLSGADRLGIPLGEHDLERALDLAQHLIRQAGTPASQVLKLLLTRGSGGRGYQLPLDPVPRLLVSLHSAPPTPSAEGVSVSISDIPLTVNPVLAGLKTLNRLEQVMASRSMPDECYEALMTGGEGDLREGTRTALLYRKKGQWWTPPRDRVAVNSVMLAHVEQGLVARGEQIREGLLYPEECFDSDFEGLLLLNSVIGATPVHSIEGRKLPLTGQIATIIALAKHV